jgi:hypothetical protein
LSTDETRADLERAGTVAYAVLWLVVAGLVAVVVRMQVPTPAELLRDVAARPAVWIGANVVLIVQQVLLVVVVPLMVRVVGAGTVAADAVRGLLVLAGGALVASGVFHGVLGAHLASKVTSGPLHADLVRLAELVHALGDTCWFIGVAALIAVTAVAVGPQWVASPAGRRLAVVGVVGVVCNVLQFGWFFDHAFGVFAGPGTLLQSVWIAGTGLVWGTRPDPGRPAESAGPLTGEGALGDLHR